MLSQEQVLSCKDGNVQLYETDHQESIEVRPMVTLLPTRSPKVTAFHTNPYFAKALKYNKPHVAFLSKSGRSILISPTKPYASIRVFSRKANKQEWDAMWAFVYDARSKLQRRFGGHFYISTIGIDVPQLHIRLERRPHITYFLNLNSVSAPDKSLILKYANDSTGWTGRYRCSVKEGQQGTSDVRVLFASPDDMARLFGQDFKQLSVSSVDTSAVQSKKPTIYFNLRNWNRVPRHFRGSLTTYRKYLVQHELGHALFHVWDHDEEPSSGTCPVMMQQTKGTHTCMPGINHHPHTCVPEKSKKFGDWLFNLDQVTRSV
jgi:hypothetical protein